MIPEHPKIYHILHTDRLASVLAEGGLWCDAEMQQRGNSGTMIGMGRIKHRRLNLPVKCHSDDNVGDYVPFYFCPRSIMLYIIYKRNHPDLSYRGGQEPIVHLQADIQATVAWVEAQGKPWAFTLSNAGAYYTQFRSRLDQIGEINWRAVTSTDFSSDDVRESKQAEFLLSHFFPWELVERIGVCNQMIQEQVVRILQEATHRPQVDVLRAWYY